MIRLLEKDKEIEEKVIHLCLGLKKKKKQVGLSVKICRLLHLGKCFGK